MRKVGWGLPQPGLQLPALVPLLLRLRYLRPLQQAIRQLAFHPLPGRSGTPAYETTGKPAHPCASPWNP